MVYETVEGDIVTTKIKNETGWYALVCFYDTPELMVDVYDMHVFSRYYERWMRDRRDKRDPISVFLGRCNFSGTMILEDEGRFKKRIKDGATMGAEDNGIIYHKTYMNDDMLVENKLEYLLEL